MIRRTFLTLLGAVAWPWKAASNRHGHYLPIRRNDGPTSSSFRLTSVYWTPRGTHSDAEAFRRAIAETRPIDLSGETTVIRFFHE